MFQGVARIMERWESRVPKNNAESGLRKQMICRRILPLALLLLALPSCGGTWIDDDGNFRRVFGFSKPQDVEVLHTYYWKSPHWSVEYSYFISLRVDAGFATRLTSAGLMISVAPDEAVLNSCGDKRPQWFLPKPLTSYEAWIPKAATGYRVFRDKAEGTLFLCDERM
jgi:hypothetical protein